MKWNYFAGRLAVALTVASNMALAAWADDFAATRAPVGRSGDTLVTPVNQIITPAGTQVHLPGIRPQAVALSRDGKILITAGLTNGLQVVDPTTGTILQQVPLPAGGPADQGTQLPVILNSYDPGQLSYSGLVFSPEGRRIYFSSINGEVKVFGVAADRTVSPLFSVLLPPVHAGERTNELPTGIAVSPDGGKLYVAANLSNRLLELDARSGTVQRSWEVGIAPLNVILAGHKIYVSNWGGRRPEASSLSAPAGPGVSARVDARGVASEGSVSVIDLAAGKVAMPPHEIVIGPHAGALALSPNGRWLVAASAGSDMLSVIDTRSDEVVETVTTRQTPGDPFGAQPDALAFDSSGRILYCANGTQNAVAVFQFAPRQTRLLGLIPVGWFPAGLAYDAHDKRICVANLKSIGTKRQPARLGAEGLGYNTKLYAGSLSLVPVPSKDQLAAFTSTALANLRYPMLAQAMLPPRPDRGPVPVPERTGEPSVFQHVIYIIKENRTYDQVLGDVPAGNGDASLCSFGENVTPNEHRLVHDFALLDNTYCSGILSADGHNWTDSAIATDYIERGFAGWVRSYPAGGFGAEGTDALAFSPAGFIWDDALAHGRTVHDFGEFTTSTSRWKDPSVKRKITFADNWQDFTGGGKAIEYTCEPDIASLRPLMERDWVSWDLDVPDVVRAAKFIKRLKQYEQQDDLPALTILWLPNDHTSGDSAGSPTPAAQVADNDLAMGQILEAVSHSKFWKDTCVFAIEDDPQNGWDHVSGYRTTAYVISPYTRRGAEVGTQYNTTSLIRTIELMLGLPPMNQMDATATPMFDCFTAKPDFTAYTALTNNVPLNQMNPPVRKIADARLRKDALASAKLPLDKPDQCDEDVLNRILWRATMGGRPYPEWAAKAAPDD